MYKKCLLLLVTTLLPEYPLAVEVVEGGGAGQGAVVDGHIRPDGAFVNAPAQERNRNPGVPGEKAGVVLHLGGEAGVADVGGVGGENGHGLPGGGGAGVFQEDAVVVADGMACQLVVGVEKTGQTAVGQVAVQLGIGIGHGQNPVHRKTGQKIDIPLGHQVGPLGFCRQEIRFQRRMVGLLAQRYHPVDLPVQGSAVLGRGAEQTLGQHWRVQGDEADGDTGGVAVGNFVVQGVVLLLPHFEQAVYKATLTLDGIEVPIVEKQIAPAFLPGIV